MELHALLDGLAWATTALTVVLLRRFYADRFPPAPGRSLGDLATWGALVPIIKYGRPGK